MISGPGSSCRARTEGGPPVPCPPPSCGGNHLWVPLRHCLAGPGSSVLGGQSGRGNAYTILMGRGTGHTASFLPTLTPLTIRLDSFSGLDYRSNPLTRDECCPFDGSMRTATTAAQQATDGSLPSPIAVHLWETSSLCLQLFTRNYWSTTLTVRPLRSWTGRLFPVWMALSASSCARPSSIGVSSTSHCTFSEQGGVVRLPV